MTQAQMTTVVTKTTNGTGTFSEADRLKILEALAKAELNDKDKTVVLSKHGIDNLSQITAWKRLVTQKVLVPNKDKHPHLHKLAAQQRMAKARAAKKPGKRKMKAKPQQATARAKPQTRKRRAVSGSQEDFDRAQLARQVVSIFETHDKMCATVVECIGVIEQALGE